MSPPTTRPRLSQVDPDALGQQTVAQMRDHLGRQAVAVGLTVVEAGPADLAYTIADLARYARDGVALDAPVQEYLVSLIPLWSAPLGHAPSPLEIEDEADPDEPLGLVIHAALAREAIEQGQPVTARQLGALAGVDAQHIRLLARDGEIDLDAGRATAKEARRWLSGRGVAGFTGRRK